MGLFAAALLITMGIITGVSQSSAQSREYTLARETARQVMEEQRNQAFGNIGVPAPTPYILPVPFTNNGQSLVVEYTVSVTVTNVGGNYKDIVVKVAWKHGEIPREIQLETSAANL